MVDLRPQLTRRVLELRKEISEEQKWQCLPPFADISNLATASLSSNAGICTLVILIWSLNAMTGPVSNATNANANILSLLAPANLQVIVHTFIQTVLKKKEKSPH